MTKDTPPKAQIEWEPVAEGIELALDHHAIRLPMTSVRELQDDMEEAFMLARGYEKIEVPVSEVLDKCIVRVAGNDLRVASTLAAKSSGDWITVLQSAEGHEVILPSDMLVTAYRPVE